MKLKKYIDEVWSIDSYPNNNLLTEAGLSRLIQKMKDKDFAVISAYRNEYDKQENIRRNRNLRAEFNSNEMGVYQLVGHWQECSLEGVEYEDCPKNKLIDVIERSYLVVRPGLMNVDEFQELIRKLTDRYNQDAAVLSIDNTIHIITPSGKLTKIGDKITLNKISQAYSQFVKKINIPFVFEAEVPGSNSGRQVFKINNVLYPVVTDKNEFREWKEIYNGN